MNRRIFLRNLGIGATGIATGIPLSALAADDFTVISILHTNDIHSHVEPFSGTNADFDGKGGLARIAGTIKHIRSLNPNTLVFDAGDAFQGTPYFNYFGGELIYKLMSIAGYNATTIGNHEFDNGLQGLLDALPSAEFPVVNSNYDFSDTILAGKIPRWKTYKMSGIKAGVYGLGIELDGLVAPAMSGNTKYLDPVATAHEMEQFLRYEQKCDLVICLSHLGLQYRNNKISDILLAAETSETDLIIGGHTHSFMEDARTIKNKAGNPVIVNQAWWGGLVLGQIDFVFERVSKNRQSTVINNTIQP